MAGLDKIEGGGGQIWNYFVKYDCFIKYTWNLKHIVIYLLLKVYIKSYFQSNIVQWTLMEKTNEYAHFRYATNHF